MDMKMIQSFSVDHTAIARYRCGGYAFARAHHRDLSQK